MESSANTDDAARETFLMQRDQMVEQARTDKRKLFDGQQDSPDAFVDFASFDTKKDEENDSSSGAVKKSDSFDAPDNVTDATGEFFDAISAPPQPSDSNVQTNRKRDRKNTVSNKRHAELLEQAREDQVAWVEKDVATNSPPAPEFAKGTQMAIKPLGGESNAPGPDATNGRARTLDSKATRVENNSRQYVLASNEGKVSGGGKTGGFLNTTERLFGFLNRFDSNDESASKNQSQEVKDTQTSSNTRKPVAAESGAKRTSFNYKHFKEKLKNPAAAEILKTMKSFVQSTMRSYRDTTKKRLSRQEYGQRVRDFLNQVAQRMKVMDHWRNENDDEWENTIEGLEKFVMSKVYEAVFCPQEQDKEADVDMSKRIKSLCFVEFRHLDISGPETGKEMTESWKLAMSELRKMDGYKAPRDKMVCLLNCCKVISQLLSDARRNADEKLPGADEFLPALIYVVLKANPTNLKSNLEYIDCFRNPDKMLSEPGYWYTNLYSAVTFIENVQHDSLTITEAEFESGMSAAKHEMEVAKRKHSTSFDFAEMNTELLSSASTPSTTTGSISGKSNVAMDLNALYAESNNRKSTVMNESALMKNFLKQNEMVVKKKSLRQALYPPLPKAGKDAKGLLEWKSRRFRFAHLDVSELKVVQVAELLEEYQNLVKTCRKLMENEGESLVS